MGISDFKDFGYNPLHTNKYSAPPGWRHDPRDPVIYKWEICGHAAYSDNERFNALNPIYKEVVGKDIDKSSIVHLDNKDHRYSPDANFIFRKINTPSKIAFVDVNVDRHMVDHMNETLAKDNPLREKIDVNGDGILSHNEISDYFDKFAVNGKISHFDMENIYALQNNAIIQDALFTKYNGDGSFNTNAQLSYEDIKDKSIISESDFRKLDVAFDGAEDGLISKDVFDKFKFDKDDDHVIDKDEYAEGMQRVDEYLEKRADIINTVPSDKECNNECATTNLPKPECPEVS